MKLQNTCRLFLDDFRTPVEVFLKTKEVKYNHFIWFIVKNYDEFCNLILEKYSKNELPKIISIGHILTNNNKTSLEETSYHCIKWLCLFCIDNNIKLPEILIHLTNPVDKKLVEDMLTNFNNLFPELS